MANKSMLFIKEMPIKKSQWDTTSHSIQCLQIENPAIYKHESKLEHLELLHTAAGV